MTKQAIYTLFNSVKLLLDTHRNDNTAHGLNNVVANVTNLTTKVGTNTTLTRALMPVFLNDTFDRADSVSLGAPWVALFTAPRITANAAAPSNAAVVNAAVVDTGQADHIITANLLSPNDGEASILARVVDINTHILAQTSGNALTLYFVQAGAYNLQGNVALTPGQPVEVSCIGNALNISSGGTLVYSATLPASMLTGTKAGFRVSGSGRVNDFRAAVTVLTASPATDLLQREGRLGRIMAMSTRTTLIQDTFTRADAAALGAAEVGGNWTLAVSKSPSIVSNGATMGAGGGIDGAYINKTATRLHAYAHVKVGAAPQLAGITFGTNLATHQFIRVYRTTNSVVVQRYSGGAYSTAYEVAVVAASGALERLDVICANGAVWVLLDNVLILAFDLPAIPTQLNLMQVYIGDAGRIEDVYFVSLGELA